MITDRGIRIVKKWLKLLLAVALANQEQDVVPNWAQAPGKRLIVHSDFAAVVQTENHHSRRSSSVYTSFLSIFAPSLF